MYSCQFLDPKIISIVQKSIWDLKIDKTTFQPSGCVHPLFKWDLCIYGSKFHTYLPLDLLFLNLMMTLVGSRPLDQWIRTFQRHLWTYFWVWYWRRNLIQLFQFASFILYFELNVRHITVTSITSQLIIKTNTILLCCVTCVVCSQLTRKWVFRNLTDDFFTIFHSWNFFKSHWKDIYE